MNEPSLHVDMRIFRDLVTSYNGVATVARLIDVARASPTATRLLLQLEATTTGDEIVLPSDEASALPRARDGAAAWLRGFLPLYAGQWHGE